MTSSIFLFSFLIAGCMSLCCGLMSPFVLVRGRGLLSDAISHSTLLGIGVMFLVFRNASMPVLLLGAGFSSLAAFFCIVFFRRSKLNEDAILATVLTIFFGGGLVAFSIIARLEIGSSAGLSKFLFGNLSALWKTDLYVFLVATFLVVSCVLLYYKKWKLISLDYNHASSLAFPVDKWVLFFDAVLLGVILVGIETVGVVLMGAMLIGPAAIAKQWTTKFSHYYGLSIVVAVFAAFAGVFLSSKFSHLPPGPAIVLLLALFFALSAFKNKLFSAKGALLN